jgi:hypothetical protein
VLQICRSIRIDEANTQMPQYCVHGLKLESDFEIPELPPLDAGSVILDDRPVFMTMATLPASIDHHAVSKDGYLIGNDEILIALDNGIRCHIADATAITLDQGSPQNASAARLFGLSAGLGCLLHQRKYLPIHSAAIKTPAGCVAFCGNAGDGKSTLAASFAASGFKLFSDDRLTFPDTPLHRFLAVPSVPVVHLFTESALLSGLGDSHLAVDSYRFGKHIHLIEDSYAVGPAPLVGLYFTDWLEDVDAAPSISVMNPVEAMIRLRRDVSLAHLVELLDQEQQFMQWSARMCGSLPVYHLARPRNQLRLDECMDLIIADITDKFGR